MNNNDIVQELQRRGYKAELHEVMKNGNHKRRSDHANYVY